MRRTNYFNTGKAFEVAIQRTIDAYRQQGRLYCEKVEPPTMTVGSGPARRTIYLANPFLDYIGCLSNGRLVTFECKSTTRPRLPLGPGGLAEKQIANMRRWRKAGAIVFLLWECQGRVVLCLIDRLEAWELAKDTGAKSIRFDSQTPVPQGNGFVLHDFLPMIERDAPSCSADDTRCPLCGKEKDVAALWCSECDHPAIPKPDYDSIPIA